MSNANALHDLRAAQALIERALQALTAAPAVREPAPAPSAPARKPIRFLGSDEPQPAPEP